MKRIISFSVLLVLMFLLAGCETKEVLESSDSETGLSYNIRIEEFTEKFNSLYEEKFGEGIVADENGKLVDIDSENWKEIESQCFSVSGKNCQFVVMLDEMDRISSITTATTNEVWQKNSDNVINIGTVASLVCRDYDLDKFDYVKEMYKKSISGNCYYEDVIYKIIGTESSDDVIVKMISIPADKEYLENQTYTDYEKYKEGKCDFGKH